MPPKLVLPRNTLPWNSELVLKSDWKGVMSTWVLLIRNMVLFRARSRRKSIIRHFTSLQLTAVQQ